MAIPVSALSVAYDEFGRPFIILKAEQKKERLRGLDALKVRSKWQLSPIRRSECLSEQLTLQTQQFRNTS
jgi:hypothetical protein